MNSLSKIACRGGHRSRRARRGTCPSEASAVGPLSQVSSRFFFRLAQAHRTLLQDPREKIDVAGRHHRTARSHLALFAARSFSAPQDRKQLPGPRTFPSIEVAHLFRTHLPVRSNPAPPSRLNQGRASVDSTSKLAHRQPLLIPFCYSVLGWEAGTVKSSSKRGTKESGRAAMDLFTVH